MAVSGKYVESCVEGHSVMIHDRGGLSRISQLIDIGKVEYSREQDQGSIATVTIYGAACSAQAAVLRRIRTRRHELVIFRGGLRPWEGPITSITWFSNRVEVVARDVSEYLNYTALSKDWPNALRGGPVLMGDRLSQIITHELTAPYSMLTNQGVKVVPRWETITPPINVLPFFEVRPGTVGTTSDTVAFEMTVGDHLSDLTRSGLNYTVLGRKILIWDGVQPLGQLRTMTETDFYGEMKVVESGADYVSVSHTSASREQGDPATPVVGAVAGVGNAGGSDAYYGVWTEIATLQTEEGDESAQTQTSLNSQAQRNQSGRDEVVPVQIIVPGDGGIRLSHDLTLNELVPGVEVQINARLNLRPVSQVNRLVSVKITEDVTGEKITGSFIASDLAGVL